MEAYAGRHFPPWPARPRCRARAPRGPVSSAGTSRSRIAGASPDDEWNERSCPNARGTTVRNASARWQGRTGTGVAAPVRSPAWWGPSPLRRSTRGRIPGQVNLLPDHHPDCVGVVPCGELQRHVHVRLAPRAVAVTKRPSLGRRRRRTGHRARIRNPPGAASRGDFPAQGCRARSRPLARSSVVPIAFSSSERAEAGASWLGDLIGTERAGSEIRGSRLVGEGEVLGRGLAVASGPKLEAESLPFVEGGESGPFNGRDVDESVVRAIFRLDEPVTLGGVEPLDGTSWHIRFLQMVEFPAC